MCGMHFYSLSLAQTHLNKMQCNQLFQLSLGGAPVQSLRATIMQPFSNIPESNV